MSSSPQLFDMSKAMPIGQPETPASANKPLFDMSKATVITRQENAREALAAVGGLPKHTAGAGESHYVPGLPPPGSQPIPKPIQYAIEATPFLAGVGEVPAIGRGVVAGVKATLPEAGATVEQTAANVTEWAIKRGIPYVGAASLLLHKLLGGSEK